MSIDQARIIGAIDMDSDTPISILDSNEIEIKVIEVGIPGPKGDGRGFDDFDTVADLIASSDTEVGYSAAVRGYYEPYDGGAANYIIVEDNTDKPWAIALNNGLFAEISEKEEVNYKQFGAFLDGVNDDAPAMLLCHKYADSLFNYNGTGLLKQYFCKVTNHQGIIYKKGTDAIACCSDVDLSGSTLLVDDTNATWFGIYVWGDANSLFFDYELSDDMKASFEADNFVIKMPSADQLPANTVLKIEEEPYSARDDSGYLYTVARRELMVHGMNGICTAPLVDDWTHAGGEEINCQISDLEHGTVTTQQAFTRLKASYTYVPNVHGTFVGCDVKLDVSANKYCSVMWCKRHNATVKDFLFHPKQEELHNTKFRNAMIYLWDSYNVTVKNLQGFNASGQEQGSESGTSGYMLRITNCADVHVEDCRMQGYWGVTAMDSVKNIYFKRCHLNRLDIHDYFANLYADNCTFYNHAIQIGYGRGVASFTNCLFFYNNIPNDSYPSSHIVEFNLTYGRIFEGSVYVDNCRVVTKNPPDDEFNIFKMEFSPHATAITKHFKLPEIICKNLYIHSSNPNTHYAYFKITGTRRATTSTTRPSHVYGVSNDGTVTWEYYGRGINWGDDIRSIPVNGVLRVMDSFLDKDKKTQFYNRRYYICTQAGMLDFSGSKPQNKDNIEFTCGTAKLRYAPDILWKAKHNYAVGDLCAASQSNFYPLNLFRCTKAGQSNGYPPTHTSGTVLEGVNDAVNEPDECWWSFVSPKASWCNEWNPNMSVTAGERIHIPTEGRIYEVVKSGVLTEYPPYDTFWFGKSECGTAILRFIGATWTHHAWYAKGSFCEVMGNIYQLVNHDGTTTGVLPTRGNPFCVDGDIIWEYKSGYTSPVVVDPDPPDTSGAVGWQANTPFAVDTTIKSGTHLYVVQMGTSGSSQPTATAVGTVIMDGEIPLECLGRHALTWRVAGNTYAVGDIICDNTFVVKCITAGTTNINNKWGPVAGAAWTSAGTFQDGSCVWQRLTNTEADGVWRNSSTKYKSGMIFICDYGETGGQVRLYLSLPGTSGSSAPTDTSGNVFKNGTVILKYIGEAAVARAATTNQTTAAEIDTWQANTAYAQGAQVISNGYTYECVFDGKLVLPNKTIFENITTNMKSGHIFWFYSGTNVPTKQGDRPWVIVANNCEAVDNTAEGITGNTPYFCHTGNPAPTIVIK